MLENIYPCIQTGEEEKEIPLVSFLGNLIVSFVTKKEEKYQVVTDAMLPKDCDIEALYLKACENLVRDVEFVISNTMYGGFAILSDGETEACAILYQHIWKMCCEKLKDDVIIMVPAKDTLLFVPAQNQEAFEQMIEHGLGAYSLSHQKISKSLFLFSKEKGVLEEYGTNN